MNTQNVSRKAMSKVQKALVAVLTMAMILGALPAGKAHASAYRAIVDPHRDGCYQICPDLGKRP